MSPEERRAALVERVKSLWLDPAIPDADKAASLVIDIIRAEALEEAAKVVAALDVPPGNTYSYGMYWEDGVAAAEDAIRALIPSEEGKDAGSK